MQRVLFWVGYCSRPWDGNTKAGLGGTEVAVINIAERLVTYGFKVTVAGEVNNSVVNGVEWIDIQNFQARYSGQPNQFDIAIGVDYIHFVKYLEDCGQTPSKKLFWVHNTDYYKWYLGEELENHLDLFFQLDYLIAPSNFACGAILENTLKGKDHLIPSDFKLNVRAIGNGINIDDFNINAVKDPNKFIWSSAVDRGLSELLDRWHTVKEVLPNATLDVYYPQYSNPHVGDWYNIEGILDKLNETKDLGVTDMGSVSQHDLHVAMQKATYWMYLTQYEETFCITAMEMAAAGVLPICSDNAALKEVIIDGIIIPTDDYETMFDMGIQILSKLDAAIMEKAIKSGKIRAKHFTWNSAASIWFNLLQNNF